MLPDEREVGGLRCSDVLARLSDYVDGDLGEADVAMVRAHVAACDNCARFGTSFAWVLDTVREHLASVDPLDEAVAGRLRDRLAQERHRP